MTTEPTREALPRTLGARTLATLTIGIVIGSGIFRTPSEIAGLVHSPSLILLVWAAGGGVTLCLGLCLAELGAMYPRVGGIYVYLEEAFGKPTAFIFGWTFLLINPANWAAIALIAAAYIGSVLGLGPAADRWIATGALAMVTIVNVASLPLAVRLNDLFTLVKGAALLGIAGIIAFAGAGAAGQSAVATAGIPPDGAFGLALIAVLWPYEGVAAASAMAGEVQDPARNVPRGLIGGVLIITLLYLIINLAFLSVLNPQNIAASRFVARDAATAALGDMGGAVAGIAGAVAVLGALIAAGTCDPRILFAMARERLFFSRVGDVHPRTMTPHVAVLVSAVLAMLYVWISSFEALAAQFVLGMWMFYALCVIGLIRLRIARPDLPRPYRMPGFPWLPGLFIAASLGLLVNALVAMPLVSLSNIVVVAMGYPVYRLWRRYDHDS